MRPDPSTQSAVDPPGPTLPGSRRHASAAWRAVLERAALREILMGAQDDLTNVLAVVLGVAIGSGRSDLVAQAAIIEWREKLGTTQVHTAIYVLAIDPGYVILSCRSDDPPKDHWLSIAETFEFLPAEE